MFLCVDTSEDSELPFGRLLFAGGFLQPVDDVIEVGGFLFAQAAVLGVAREAEQAKGRGAALVPAGARSFGG